MCIKASAERAKKAYGEAKNEDAADVGKPTEAENRRVSDWVDQIIKDKAPGTGAGVWGDLAWTPQGRRW